MMKFAAITMGVAALCLSAAPVKAQNAAGFMQGVYSTTPGCVGGEAAQDLEQTMKLDATGFWAIEYNCEFLRMDPVRDAAAFVATAACSAPGELTPELVLVRAEEMAQNPAEIVSLLSYGQTEPKKFYRCRN